VKGSLIWVKPNHGTGDLQYSFAPKHERIIHATRGKIELSKRLPDVFNGKEFIDSEHPTKKPIDLMETLIKCTTDKGDIVADYFMGIGSTALATIKADRVFFGVELNKEYYDDAINTVYNYLNKD